MIEITIKGEPKEMAALLLELGERQIDMENLAENVCKEIAEKITQIWKNQPLETDMDAICTVTDNLSMLSDRVCQGLCEKIRESNANRKA